MDFEPMYPGFESRESHDFFFFSYFFLSLLFQCKFANSTLLSLLSFSYFITPYDAQAFSALIFKLCVVRFTCMVQLPYVCYMDLNFALSNSLTTRDANS